MEDYLKLIRGMIWSYSRIGSYKQCPYSFYLMYIEKEKKPESNFYAEVGSFVHKILEMIFKGELELDDAPEYFRKNWTKNVKTKLTEKTRMDNTYLACATYLADVDFEWLNDYEVLGIEKKIRTKIGGYPFVGYIDLLLREKATGKIIVLDHKSAKYPLQKDEKTPLKAHAQEFESYKRQLYLYSKAVIEEYGVEPVMLMWNHFKDQKYVRVEFNRKDYEAAIEWFLSMIKQIEKDILFMPKKDFFYCANLCNFRNTCEYRERKKFVYRRKR